MALAAFASVFMGNSLEGALLLAMFNLAHIGNFSIFRALKFKLFFIFILVVLFTVILLKTDMTVPAEEYFTSRSMVDVKELKDSHPDFALVLEADTEKQLQFTELNYKKVPVCDLELGSYILVRAGEVSMRIPILSVFSHLNTNLWCFSWGLKLVKATFSICVIVCFIFAFNM